jgi:hypothetical protein
MIKDCKLILRHYFLCTLQASALVKKITFCLIIHHSHVLNSRSVTGFVPVTHVLKTIAVIKHFD